MKKRTKIVVFENINKGNIKKAKKVPQVQVLTKNDIERMIYEKGKKGV